MSIDITTLDNVVYPESDGKPMADNTLQWDWMVKIVGELRTIYAGQEVFIAGDLFWYPVKGQPKIVTAPDALVAFGRPPGYRGSYQQWKEGGIAPQVVFEVLSPSNTDDELEEKLEFYDRHGVEEYYFIDPYEELYDAYVRRDGRLRHVHNRNGGGFVSPRLGIRFESKGGLKIFTPDGREFQTREDRVLEMLDELRRSQAELLDERERSELEFKRAEAASKRAETEKQRAEAEKQRAEAERLAKERLAAKLRELGVDPESVG